ncbi:carbohydrate-binding module family 5 protein [Cylindrobasidium torrendii FP15055 ss-10]|uniref:Carbohydrate-binding module family 5 protein n=1 Tax=Cylindrobasidium torrendii FP15055 ss-10 TaxID=1314674 RepID=A0A0D7BVJ3_9AGAR|nr:carbohydrate-binding module family 5 protein [Cylindrobasidium torrendii FP15055 ss-10]
MFANLLSLLVLGFFAFQPAFTAPTSTALVPRAFTGEATYYDPGLGACGIVNTSSDLIVAVSLTYFNKYPGAGTNPNLNPICGKKIRVTYEGRTVDVAVEDNCPTCAEYDLDLTMTAIKYLVDDPVFVGRLKGVTWEFIDTDGGDGGNTGCGGVAAWTATSVYTAGQKAYYGGYIWTAKWWTQGDIPGSSNAGATVWTQTSTCS